MCAVHVDAYGCMWMHVDACGCMMETYECIWRHAKAYVMYIHVIHVHIVPPSFMISYDVHIYLYIDMHI